MFLCIFSCSEAVSLIDPDQCMLCSPMLKRQAIDNSFRSFNLRFITGNKTT